jgi:hypothetical protein
MSETNQSPDLSALENDYEIVGEVRAGDDARTFAATRKDAGVKRRDEQAAVLISVVRTPAGDEGNALSHLAADTKLLTGMTHRRLIPVIDGRWIATDAFAVITQRTLDASLAQRLASGERFSTPRIAAILREVNGLLEWAREQSIVHRNVTPDRLYLEAKTDRVRLSFSVTPLRRINQTDAETEDARTIVRLTMAMLTGRMDPAEYEGKSLTELRPDLPDQLEEATNALLDEANAHTAADVNDYLALVGLAGTLAAGETDVERIREETLGEQRTEREKLAAERAAFEQEMADQRVAFERTMKEARDAFDNEMADERDKLAKETADLRDKFAKETADLRRAVAVERDKLAKEKDELQRAVTVEREFLVTRRTELEQSAAERRAEIERVAADDRRAIEALRAEIKRAGEREVEAKRDAALSEISDAESTLDHPTYAAPLFVPPMLSPLNELVFDDDTALMRDEEDAIVVTQETAAPVGAEGDRAVAVTDSMPPRKEWLLPAGLAALAAIISVAAVALVARQSKARPAPPPVAVTTPKRVVTQPPTPMALPPVVPLPQPSPEAVAAADSAARVFATADSIRKEAAAAARRRARRLALDSARKRDSLARIDSVRPDTNPE